MGQHVIISTHRTYYTIYYRKTMSCSWVFTRGARTGELCDNPSKGEYCSKHKRCPHDTIANECVQCGGSRMCEHGVRRSYCKQCKGNQRCTHDRVRTECPECGGSQVCTHGRRRTVCALCGGRRKCTHGKPRCACTICFDRDLKKVHTRRFKQSPSEQELIEEAKLLQQLTDMIAQEHT